MRMQPKAAEKVVSDSVRRLRKGNSWTQDELANKARAHGLNWTQSIVHAIETGARRLSISEFLLLPVIFSVKMEQILPQTNEPQVVSEPMSLGEAFRNFRKAQGWSQDETACRAQRVGLPWDRDTIAGLERSSRRLYASEILRSGVLYKQSPEVIIKLCSSADINPCDNFVGDTARSAERQAASKFKVSPEKLVVAAHKLWGRGLTDERDRRLANIGRHYQGPPHARRATRGHISRQLLMELKDVMHQ